MHKTGTGISRAAPFHFMIHHFIPFRIKQTCKLGRVVREPVDKTLAIKTSCNLAILMIIFQQSCSIYFIVGIVKIT